MRHPDRWRETIDLATLGFRNIDILEVMGYPHAGNDVFHVRVSFQGAETTAFIKVERQDGADIANEVSILSSLSFPYCPKILDFSLDQPRYIVTEEVPGERLSLIFANNPDTNIKCFLSKQGVVLSELHALHIHCDPVKDRRFFHIPSHGYCFEHGFEAEHEFLITNKPVNPQRCFVHGDFHYANILWRESEISCVLDYELSGIGIREFDMAWSVVLRPGQKFLTSMDDVESFLDGYDCRCDLRSIGHARTRSGATLSPLDYRESFSRASFYYYFIMIAVHFSPLGDDEYKQHIKRLVWEAVRLHDRLICSAQTS